MIDSVRPNRDVICPAGHFCNMTQYGIGLYECHRCGRYMFTRKAGVAEWIEPHLVPPGLRELAVKVSAMVEPSGEGKE